MFTTCIHCNGDLGRNEAFETFPVGTRLAFDAANGRLWVVCRSCGRWNLTPLDERWETIEQAERRFRDSRLRVSTDNVGLARLREGVDLIRVGAPQRPEMAAWRYGDQFGSRRKRQLLITGVVVGSAATIVGGMLTIGASIGSFGGLFGNANLWQALVHGRQTKSIGRIALADGTTVEVQRKHARMSTLERSDGSDDFALRLESVQGTHLLLGDHAMRVAARLMPTVNRFGGSKRDVQSAVSLLEEVGDPLSVLRTIQNRFGATERAERWARKKSIFGNETGAVTVVPGVLHAQTLQYRLALEMALHEESERRAMDGELAALEAAWREAEEIARISDSLVVPASIETQLEELKRRETSRP